MSEIRSVPLSEECIEARKKIAEENSKKNAEQRSKEIMAERKRRRAQRFLTRK